MVLAPPSTQHRSWRDPRQDTWSRPQHFDLLCTYVAGRPALVMCGQLMNKERLPRSGCWRRSRNSAVGNKKSLRREYIGEQSAVAPARGCTYHRHRRLPSTFPVSDYITSPIQAIEICRENRMRIYIPRSGVTARSNAHRFSPPRANVRLAIIPA